MRACALVCDLYEGPSGGVGAGVTQTLLLRIERARDRALSRWYARWQSLPHVYEVNRRRHPMSFYEDGGSSYGRLGAR
jgi:hypothetical protein